MEFIARLPADLDQAMTLFQLRRIGAEGEFHTAGGAKDMQMAGKVPDDKVDALLEAMSSRDCAMHVGERHVGIKGGAITDYDSIEAAEAHLGGPYTMPGTTRATWAFGDPVKDHVVQIVYSSEEHMQPRAIMEKADGRADAVMRAMQDLQETGVIRKFRTPGDVSKEGETFGLSRSIRDRIDKQIRLTTQAVDTLAPDFSD